MVENECCALLVAWDCTASFILGKICGTCTDGTSHSGKQQEEVSRLYTVKMERKGL